MPLERYALGQGKPRETFCWWMEFGTPALGSIRGGNAQKHLIYKRKEDLGWYHSDKYRDEVEAWEKVRAAFVRAFELARQGEWKIIDELDALEGGAALRCKTLHLYFPADVLNVASKDHLLHFLRLLGRPEGDDASLRTVTLNRALLDALRATGLFNGWSTNEIGYFLYTWADPRESHTVVKLPPARMRGSGMTA